MRMASSSRNVPSASALAVYSAVSLHMALGNQVVDLRRLSFLDDANEIRRIGHVGIVHQKPQLRFVRILIEVLDPARIE